MSWWSRGGDDAAHVTQLVVSMYMIIMMMMVPFHYKLTLSWSNRHTQVLVSSFMSKKLFEDRQFHSRYNTTTLSGLYFVVWNESPELKGD